MKNTITGREYLPSLRRFAIEGEVVSICPFGDGHIGQTFRVTTTTQEYIFQRMNTYVFPDVASLMANVCAVTAHLAAKGRETLHLIPTLDGAYYVETEQGCFRVYVFLADTMGYNRVESPEVFRRAGEGFGTFQKDLADFDARRLSEVIPHFHDTPKRFRDFLSAVEKDVANRARTCREEIDFFLSHRDTFGHAVRALSDGSLPLRVTHNDTKLNNVLIDVNTQMPRAVIDLDTVMPGSLIYDFGDAVRFGASTAAEDEADLSRVHFDMDLFRAYAEGFCGKLADFATPAEAGMMAYGAYLMTAECGMRFLADYLAGDVYFSTAYPKHNLIRARTQIRLASEMEAHRDEMERIVREVLPQFAPVV